MALKLDVYDKASIDQYMRNNPQWLGGMLGGTYYKNPYYDSSSKQEGSLILANAGAGGKNPERGGEGPYYYKPLTPPKEPAPKPPAPKPSGGGGGGSSAPKSPVIPPFPYKPPSFSDSRVQQVIADAAQEIEDKFGRKDTIVAGRIGKPPIVYGGRKPGGVLTGLSLLGGGSINLGDLEAMDGSVFRPTLLG